MAYNFQALEKAVNDFALNAEKEFNIDEAIVAVDSVCDIDKDDEQTRKEVKALLKMCPTLFLSENESYFPKNGYFKKVEFCAVPSRFEIKEGILFPGHRFAPFCEENIFQSEVVLIDASTGKPVKMREISCEFRDAGQYHTLLGSEQMMDFFIADHPGNSKVVSCGNYSGTITLAVADMKKFYKSSSFSEGDALLFVVEDWRTGKFSFERISAEKRGKDAKIDWIRRLEDALEKVFDEHSNYIEIPDQLANAFWNDRSLLSSPAGSIDEFISLADKVQITVIGSQTVLTGVKEFESDDVEAPQDVMISESATDSLEEILKDIGSPLKPIEIESFMLDELYNAGESFDAFFERCFDSASGLAFADDAQEAAFMNFLEDLWEMRLERYNRFGDDRKGIVRAAILGVISERVNWLNDLKDRTVDVKSVSKDKMKSLAEGALRLCTLLEMLNSENYDIADEEMDDIEEAIEKISELQDGLIRGINAQLK